MKSCQTKTNELLVFTETLTFRNASLQSKCKNLQTILDKLMHQGLHRSHISHKCRQYPLRIDTIRRRTLRSSRPDTPGTLTLAVIPQPLFDIGYTMNFSSNLMKLKELKIWLMHLIYQKNHYQLMSDQI